VNSLAFFFFTCGHPFLEPFPVRVRHGPAKNGLHSQAHSVEVEALDQLDHLRQRSEVNDMRKSMHLTDLTGNATIDMVGEASLGNGTGT